MRPPRPGGPRRRPSGLAFPDSSEPHEPGAVDRCRSAPVSSLRAPTDRPHHRLALLLARSASRVGHGPPRGRVRAGAVRRGRVTGGVRGLGGATGRRVGRESGWYRPRLHVPMDRRRRSGGGRDRTSAWAHRPCAGVRPHRLRHPAVFTGTRAGHLGAGPDARRGAGTRPGPGYCSSARSTTLLRWQRWSGAVASSKASGTPDTVPHGGTGSNSDLRFQRGPGAGGVPHAFHRAVLPGLVNRWFTRGAASDAGPAGRRCRGSRPATSPPGRRRPAGRPG